jgi:hypothetical protein
MFPSTLISDCAHVRIDERRGGVHDEQAVGGEDAARTGTGGNDGDRRRRRAPTAGWEREGEVRKRERAWARDGPRGSTPAFIEGWREQRGCWGREKWSAAPSNAIDGGDSVEGKWARGERRRRDGYRPRRGEAVRPGRGAGVWQLGRDAGTDGGRGRGRGAPPVSGRERRGSGGRLGQLGLYEPNSTGLARVSFFISFYFLYPIKYK